MSEEVTTDVDTKISPLCGGLDSVSGDQSRLMSCVCVFVKIISPIDRYYSTHHYTDCHRILQVKGNLETK